ncbi:MAG: DUF349 domain-containing protein [Erysipelothrix sp.]|nr:DUF349 domain-containing protein [Erysipelothrix sp.]
MDKIDNMENISEETEVKESLEEVVETTETSEEVVSAEEVETDAKKVAPRRNNRQPSYRSNRQFGWESLDTVQDDRKNELIQEVFDLQGDDNKDKIDEIRDEWNQIHVVGTDDRLETRFERALERHTASKEAIDEAIARKTELLTQAEEMKDSTRWNKTAEKYKELQGLWRDSGWAGEPENDELWEKFQKVNDYFFGKRKEHFDNRVQRIEEAAVIKAELVEKANEYRESEDWKATSAVMHSLMEDWKKAGFAGRGTDDQLWEQFNEARQVFFGRQNDHFEALRQDQKVAFDVKTQLVERAEALKDSNDLEETRVEMETLMDEWREAGYSGRKYDNQLWTSFQGARDHFYKRLHSQNTVSTANRLEEVETELENINAQIDSLELLNETIIAKYDNVLSRSLPSEDHDSYESEHEAREKELAELQGYIANNNKSINDHFDTLDRLNAELNKLNR